MKNKAKKQKIIFLILWGISLLLILVLSFTNGEISHRESGFFSNIYLGIVRFFLNRELLEFEINNIQFLVRKVIGHFLLFLLHGWFSIKLFLDFKKHPTFIFFIYGLVLSSLSEILQLFAGGRTFSGLDIALDFLSFSYIPLLILLRNKANN